MSVVDVLTENDNVLKDVLVEVRSQIESKIND